MPPTALEIEEELLRLQLAAASLGAFTKYTFPAYMESRHQALLDEKLEQVEKYITTGGKEGIGRLIVMMPPRHGKSEKVTVRFPAWFLGRNPEKRVIITSCTDDLAHRFSRQVRNLIESQEYQRVFGKMSLMENPVYIDSEGRNVESWDVANNRGGMVAAGIGGSIIGRGADLLVIDDPVKGRAEADSEKERQNAKDWFTSVAYTRLERFGAIVVMMQRWHRDDLAGWLLEEAAEKWEVLRLPALAEDDDPLGRKDGEALWPEKYTVEQLAVYQKVLPPRDWNALYQQRPQEASGDVFSDKWFVYDDFPDLKDISYGLQVWDTALTEKEENDYSACCTVYVTRFGCYVADVWRGRVGFPDLKRMMIQKHQQWSKVFRISRVYIENRVSGTSVMQALKKDTKGLPILALEPESERGRSKRQRAESTTAYIETGRVVFPKNATWLPAFIDELTSFPRGKHDDMVDAFVYAILKVQGGGRAPVKKDQEYYNPEALDRHARILGIMG